MSPTREEIPGLVLWAGRIALALGTCSGKRYDDAELAGAALRGLRDALGKYDPSRGAAFKTYAGARIRGEVRDALKDMRTRAAREVQLEEGPDGDDPLSAFAVTCFAEEIGAGGEAGLLRRETYAALHRALGPLAPEEQRLIELRYWDGLTWKEVSAALGISEQAAWDLDRKLRAQLKAALLARDKDEAGRLGGRVVPLSRPPRKKA